MSRMQLLRNLLPSMQFERVFRDNLRFLRSKDINSSEFFDFVRDMFERAAPMLEASATEQEGAAVIPKEELAKLVNAGTYFALRVLAQSKSAGALPALIAALMRVYKASPEASRALVLEIAKDSEYIEQVILKASNPATRTAVVDLLVTCLQASYKEEEPYLMECAAAAKARLDAVAANGGKPLDEKK